MLRNIIVQWK